MSYHYYPCMRQTGSQSMPFMQAAPQTQMPVQGYGSLPLFPLPPIGTTLPTGIPAGPSIGPMPVIPSVPAEEQPAQTLQSTQFIAGYLRTQIGRRIRVEYLIGTNGPLLDRTGTLINVGANYILMRPDNTDDLLMSDLYSIKFVTTFL